MSQLLICCHIATWSNIQYRVYRVADAMNLWIFCMEHDSEEMLRKIK